MLTIFTPAYNRAYTLHKLYESLCRQSSDSFEWLIVDDGSTDNTEALVESWIREHRIRIRYHKQKNGGKHTAINYGVREAHGEYFFIVDSDDYLSDDAVKEIECIIDSIQDDDSFAGISGVRIHPDGSRIGGSFPADDYIDTNALDIRNKYHVDGDLAEIYRTDILRQYPFPSFEDERFVTEALIWNRIAKRYKLRYTNAPIYICEYLGDGLTSQMTKLRHRNPQACMLYYSEYTRMPVPLSQKIKGALNYWRFALSDHKISFATKLKQLGLKWLPLLPFGAAMRLRDFKN